MSSSLGSACDSVFRVASTHDRIFFSGIWRCIFWDEGREDSSATCVALFVRKMIKLQPELLLVLG